MGALKRDGGLQSSSHSDTSTFDTIPNMMRQRQGGARMSSGVETRPSEWSDINAWRLVMDKVSMQGRVGRHVQCQ